MHSQREEKNEDRSGIVNRSKRKRNVRLAKVPPSVGGGGLTLRRGRNMQHGQQKKRMKSSKKKNIMNTERRNQPTSVTASWITTMRKTTFCASDMCPCERSSDAIRLFSGMTTKM